MSSQIPPNFPERLLSARERRGWSQSQLGEHTGLQSSAISHFEAGRRSPSFDNLKRLADALGVTTDYLLGRDIDVGSAGPTVAKLFRHAGNMKDEDLKMLESFAEQLALKHKRSGKEGAKGDGTKS